VEASTDAPAPSFHVQLKTRRPYFTCQHAGLSCKPSALPGAALEEEDGEEAGQQLCPVHVQAVSDLRAQAASGQQVIKFLFTRQVASHTGEHHGCIVALPSLQWHCSARSMSPAPLQLIAQSAVKLLALASSKWTCP